MTKKLDMNATPAFGPPEDFDPPRCLDCWHWQEREEHRPADNRLGTCRVNPPTVDGFPATKFDSWCDSGHSANTHVIHPSDKALAGEVRKVSDGLAQLIQVVESASRSECIGNCIDFDSEVVEWRSRYDENGEWYHARTEEGWRMVFHCMWCGKELVAPPRKKPEGRV